MGVLLRVYVDRAPDCGPCYVCACLVAAAIYVSSYYGIRFLILLYIRVCVSSTLLGAAAVYVSYPTVIYVSSSHITVYNRSRRSCYICVLLLLYTCYILLYAIYVSSSLLLYMCPSTTICVSSYLFTHVYTSAAPRWVWRGSPRTTFA